KDQRQSPVIEVIEEMVKRSMIELIVPRIVAEEFQRNQERILRESTKSLSSHIRIVKDAVETAGGDQKRTQLVLSHLDDVGHKVPLVGGQAAGSINRIQKLLRDSTMVEASEPAMLRAARRAVRKQAPFHRGKNAMADAILFELYAEATHNGKSPG